MEKVWSARWSEARGPPKGFAPPPTPPTHKHTHKDLGPLGSPLKLKPRLLIDTWVRNLILTP